MQDQNSEVDCAFFAAVFAFEIVVEGRRDLSKSNYDGAELREWSENCSANEEILHPPARSCEVLPRVRRLSERSISKKRADELAKLHLSQDREKLDEDVIKILYSGSSVSASKTVSNGITYLLIYFLTYSLIVSVT